MVLLNEIQSPQTDPDILRKFISRVMEAGITPPPLILLKREGKDPETPKKLKSADGSLNPEQRISPDDAIWKIGMGWNVGIYGFPDGLQILDLDVSDGKLIVPQDLCELLIKSADTLTSRTRSGGYHLIFRSDGSTDNSILYYNGEKAGECRCRMQYVVAPGSYVPVDVNSKDHAPDATGLYTIFHDSPIREFDSTLLPEGLTLGKPEQKQKTSSKEKGRVKPNPDDEEYKNLDGENLDFFRRKDKKLHTSLNGAYEDDRSSADFRVACRLAYYNFTEEDTARILQYYRPYEKTDREDYLNRTITKAFAATPTRWNSLQQEDGESILRIEVTGKAMREITWEALQALRRSNDPPSLFVRSGSLTRVICDEAGRPKIDPIYVDSLKGILDRAANFVTRKTEKDADGNKVDIYVPARPPTDVVTDILSLGSWEFPALKGVINVPVILDDGMIVDNPGYEPRSRFYYVPAPGLEIPSVPESPSQEDVNSAVNLLQEVFHDFPFDSQESKANVLALLITAVLRPLISGKVPLALIDKPQAGTGATLIASIISLIATGQIGGMMPMPDDDEEMRKKITSRLLAGDGLIIIDNLEGMLRSPSLAIILTTGIWNDRILGQTKTVNFEVCVTWLATGNNIRLGGDMARRCYPVRMDAQRAQPWERTGFKHPQIERWVMSERGRILAAIYTLTRAWIHAGKPAPHGIAALGSFERWRDFVGGILEVAGIPGFLGNLEKMYAETDVDTPQWTLFLETLYSINGDATFTSADIETVLESENNHTLSGTGCSRCLTDVLPDRIADAWSNRKSFTRILGNALAKQKDRQFPNGLKITKGGGRAGAIYWRIQRVGESSNLPPTVVNGESGESTVGPLHIPAI